MAENVRCPKLFIRLMKIPRRLSHLTLTGDQKKKLIIVLPWKVCR